MKFVKFLAPIGKLLGLMPTVKVFAHTELQASLTNAGFELDYLWIPEGKFTVLFVVAKIPAI
jgi:hypothetical protein